jgi:predicted DNA-binding transcriptional regulator AlpA
MTIVQICEELQIARSTYYEWRAKGRAPRSLKLPNGDIRVRRADFEQWLDGCGDDLIGGWPVRR